MTPRIGYGYDVHRLTEGRPLVLGGVTIPWEKGLLGHSDADVMLHALMDALLGAAALGNIGHLFPDSDQRYRGIDSRKLLRRVAVLLDRRGTLWEMWFDIWLPSRAKDSPLLSTTCGRISRRIWVFPLPGSV